MRINEISKEINANAQEKGFWENGIQIGEKLMLIVSEVSEALEADRKNRYTKVNMDAVNGWTSDKDFINCFTGNVKDTFEDEIADTAIRLFDLAYQMGFDLEKHIRAKHRYNKTRERLHGKKY